MTEENLKRGVEIQARLEFLKPTLDYIQRSTKIHSDGLFMDYFIPNTGRAAIPREFIDFDVLKALAEKKIEKEIKELEKEFKTL